MNKIKKYYTYYDILLNMDVIRNDKTYYSNELLSDLLLNNTINIQNINLNFKLIEKNYLKKIVLLAFKKDEDENNGIISLSRRRNLLNVGSSIMTSSDLLTYSVLSSFIKNLKSAGEYNVNIKFKDTMPRLKVNFYNVHSKKGDSSSTTNNESELLIIDFKRIKSRNRNYLYKGGLAKDCIYGSGIIRLDITKNNNTTNALNIKEKYEIHTVDNDDSLYYQTKVIHNVNDRVTFYLRYLGRDTYILDMITVQLM
jgi:hypothetical protein